MPVALQVSLNGGSRAIMIHHRTKQCAQIAVTVTAFESTTQRSVCVNSRSCTSKDPPENCKDLCAKFALNFSRALWRPSGQNGPSLHRVINETAFQKKKVRSLHKSLTATLNGPNVTVPGPSVLNHDICMAVWACCVHMDSEPCPIRVMCRPGVGVASCDRYHTVRTSLLQSAGCNQPTSEVGPEF